MLTETTWWALVLLAATTAGGLLWGLRARRRDRRERERLATARSQGLHLPASLHPVIDPERCIGSGACVAACPEGDVLGMVAGKSNLIHGAACIGHGRCVAECPVDAIRLVFGTSERGVDIPFLTPDFETSRPGVYIAGELGGMGLIKNAVRQGVGASRHALSRLGDDRRARSTLPTYDVVVIGAGPAGIGAALACAEAGARYALLEQGAFGGTVRHYVRHKLVMTEPVDVPLFGRIHRAEMSKEDLLTLWTEIVDETGLKVDSGVKLEDIRGADGDFEVQTSRGALRARKVILAIGRRGTPRPLGVPGEDSPHVCYALDDPAQYASSFVAIVGGGDSALEAAAEVAEHGGRAALVYRGEGFFRAKPKNRARIEALASAGRLQVKLQHELRKIEPGVLHATGPQGDAQVPADYVIAALGGEAPAALLERLGIRLDRWFGAPPQGGASTRIEVGERVKGGMGPWAWALLALELATIAWLAWMGRHYYLLDDAAREASPSHASLRSSGPWGHGIGVIATVVMFTNFLYALRKRWGRMRRVGSIRRWLSVHVVVGAMTPFVIAFHAAFSAKNLVASVSYVAVAAVMLTGIVGRFLYGRVHGGSAGGARLKTVLASWRMLHVILALVMVVTILAHVGVTWLFGYRWVF